MYLGIVPTKESIRLFLRRQLIKSNLDRELASKKDTVPFLEPKRKSYRSTSVLVILLPLLYYFCIYLPTAARPELVTSGDIPSTTEALYLNNQTIFRLGRQLPKPSVAPNQSIEALRKGWDNYWYYQDRFLQLFRFKKEQLQTEQKNVFTPRPPDPVVTPPPSYLSTTANPKLNPCEVKIPDKNQNISLHLTKIYVDLEQLYPMIEKGGFYHPKDCVSNHKVAILVPYRNRTEHLHIFLYNLHPFLMAQKLEYRIFVIEQFGNEKFNKGRLLNAGYQEMKKWGAWHCVIFHDVDLLPLSPMITYNCPSFPKLMASTILNMSYTDNGSSYVIGKGVTKPLGYFGGVTAFTLKQYEQVNGHSNLYWGWGSEDLDMFIRLRHFNLRNLRNNRTIAVYVELPHEQERNKTKKRILLATAADRSKYEGLSMLTYEVKKVVLNHLYTHILVDINPSPSRDATSEASIHAPMIEYQYSPLERHLPTLPWIYPNKQIAP